ncbi:MAG: N-acetylmuramoyl-L-alanine amidase [Ignavibacteria bacterium]
MKFVSISHFQLLSLVACALILSAGFARAPQETPTPMISAVSITHKAASSSISFQSQSQLRTPKVAERTARGWVLRFDRTTMSEQAIDVAMMSPKLAWKYEQRGADCFVTLASTLDSLTTRRVSPTEIEITLSKRILQRQNAPAATTTPLAATKSAKGPWTLDVIVIDPGHGGRDAGAEGVNGAYEKNVVLAIGRKLRDILSRSMPATKVVMTRETDVFIELFRRTEIANEARGKLFVSIHCNSMPTKPHPAHGCETYILRPGRNDDAARVARRENASVNFETTKKRYEGMTEDQIIVATMAQRSFVKLSESFAVKIQREATGTGALEDRGVSQAGFFVLVGASMPNVLVETGFLSNTRDAEYLASPKGQTAIAQGLARAIQEYAGEYEQSLQH